MTLSTFTHAHRAILASAVSLLAGCLPPPDGNSANNVIEAVDANFSMTEDVETNSQRTSTPESAWTYTERKDEMRGGSMKIATIAASEPLNLDAPYGQTTPELNVRRDPKFGFDIYLTSEGQPLCRSYRNDTISVKFDNGPIKEWSCAEASDGSPGIVFFNREQSFLSAIKKAKKLTMEVNYYNSGRQQITFAVADLRWP